MGKHYKLYEGEQVLTPSGEIFSAAQWLDRYPWGKMTPMVISGEDSAPFNGAFCTPLVTMVKMAERSGVDFSECVTDQDKLDLIEEWENTPIEPEEEDIDPMESIAYALQDLVVLRMIETEE